MKAVFVTLFSLAASAMASPVFASTAVTYSTSTSTSIQQEATATGVASGVNSQTITITSLTEEVKSYTSQINSTVEAVPENPTTEEQNKALNIISVKLEGITDLLHVATKAAGSDSFYEGDASNLLELVLALVYEIVFTVKAVIVKLGLGSLLTIIQPLIVALGGLVRSLNQVVDGLLVTVQGLLDTVLSAVANTLVTLL